jgi:hypothetical protein
MTRKRPKSKRKSLHSRCKVINDSPQHNPLLHPEKRSKLFYHHPITRVMIKVYMGAALLACIQGGAWAAVGIVGLLTLVFGWILRKH